MGLFKKIISAYRTAKQGKEVCCQNLSEVRDHVNLSMKEHSKNLRLEMKERMKNAYEKYKSNGTYADIDAVNDYLDGKITQKEYDEHKKFVEQKIKETDEGKITPGEFFDAISEKRV